MNNITNDSKKLGSFCSSHESSYPRPQFRRSEWMNLNGTWRFTFDDENNFKSPNDILQWPKRIQVPFVPESKLSGVCDTGFHKNLWYERDFYCEKSQERTLLHFGAVDYIARVWVNGKFVGTHQGGHTPFHFDITDLLKKDGNQVVTVHAEDNPHDLAKPRGKQDWQLDPHSIWYPRTSGIWQTVWLERVPQTYISCIRWTSFLQSWEIGCETFIEGDAKNSLQLRVKLSKDSQLLAHDSYQVINDEVFRKISLSDPGIDDFRNELLWSPEKPTLLKAEVELWEGNRLLDRIESYTALRSVAIQRDQFMLNGRPYYLRLVLDQGYWSESLMTPPSPEALKKDIELTKAMGFNGVRKHQKIEDPIYLYWADVLGLVVWEEMPSAYRFTHDSVERTIKEWIEVIDRDSSHPCIVVWVPFNESWGVPDLAEKPAHQNCVQTLYHLTKTLDPSRPVVGNDGWESSATDVIGIHDYDANPENLVKRYSPELQPAELLVRHRPAGRVLTVEGHPHRGQPIMLTEFGGIAFSATHKTLSQVNWGYSRSMTAQDFLDKYTNLLSAIHRIEIFSGFCYTQLTDVFQEANGLLFADRTPKVPLEAIAEATRGTPKIWQGLPENSIMLTPEGPSLDV